MAVCSLQTNDCIISTVTKVEYSVSHGKCYTVMPIIANGTVYPPAGGGEEPGGTRYSYVISAVVLFAVVMVTVGVVLVYRMFRKRSGLQWITKFYQQDQYSSMRNDESSSKDDQFTIGFANPIMDDIHDGEDGSVKAIGYKPLDTDRQASGKVDNLLQYKFLFPREKLVYGSEIGTGWFGKVYKGEAIRIVPGFRKTKVVIKKLKDDSTPQLRKRFLQEIEMFSMVSHKNVMQIVGQATEREPYLVVFEYSQMGNLKDFLKSHRSDAVSIKQRGVPLEMAIDIASGLEFLHLKDIYHSDLAARNCIVNSDLSVKIGDYGISRSLYENDYYKHPDSTEDSVPIRWVEPLRVVDYKDSSFTLKPPSEKGNVWSYGVTAWEIIEFGSQPYEELTDQEVIQSVIVDRLYQLPEPKQSGDLASQLYEIMKWCWIEPVRRPSIQDLVSYLTSFMENFDFHGNESSTQEPYKECLDEPQSMSAYHANYSQPVAIVRPTQRTVDSENMAERTEGEESLKGNSVETNVNVALFSEMDKRSGEEISDVQVTAICDEETVPVTMIISSPEDQLESNLDSQYDTEKSRASDTEIPHPPVTYIGDPADGLAEYDRRRTEGTQDVIHPTQAGNEIVEVKYSGSTPSVIVETGYVVLPDDTLRRKSSLRRENTQSRRLFVHFPLNILDLRTVHRYHKEEETVEESVQEEEDENVLLHETADHDDQTEKQTSETVESKNPSEKTISNAQDSLLLLDTQASEGHSTASPIIIERPISSVERMRNKSRKKPLRQDPNEWLFSIGQERDGR